MKGGLGRLWSYLNEIYERVPAVYDKGSDAISLLQDRKWRMEVFRLPLRPGDAVLDAGSGKGAISDLLRRFGLQPVMMDASYNMLSFGKGDRVQAVFEYLPFKEGVFDYVLMSFSLHASIDYERALKNLQSAMKDGARIFVVSLGKPSSRVKYAICLAYFKFIIPALALLSTGRYYSLFYGLKTIYENNPRNDVVKCQLEKLFRTIEFKEKALGAVFIYFGLLKRRVLSYTWLTLYQVP